MNIHDIVSGRNKSGRRVGRGPGSGRGKTSGRGHKGQNARSGGPQHPLFEGGRMPLYRRIPKRGFTNGRFKQTLTPVNLERLACFKKGDTVSEETLKKKGIISGKDTAVKILGSGEISKELTVDVSAVSQSAAAKIREAGGEIIGSPE